ncbi:MAG: class I SAM-dependent methyltransferase [Chloroflexi bacterium]|nr:class I SAM-dependent methyltransferase [Chloroflexota bacterium]
MTIPTPALVDWTAWLRRWDVQQQGYLYDREERFTSMLDVLEAQLQPGFVALDLACGPGSISERLLARFPEAQTIALDMDPVLLAMGQGALPDHADRITWLEDDLNDPAWTDRLIAALAGRQLRAVLSSTALHWLAGDALARIYRQLGHLMEPGSVLMNADNMSFGPHQPTFERIAATLGEREQRQAFQDRGAEDWEGWWKALEAEPALAGLFAERAARFATRDRSWTRPSYDFQVGALREAGFREVSTFWQRRNNRVLLAIR